MAAVCKRVFFLDAKLLQGAEVNGVQGNLMHKCAATFSWLKELAILCNLKLLEIQPAIPGNGEEIIVGDGEGIIRRLYQVVTPDLILRLFMAESMANVCWSFAL